ESRPGFGNSRRAGPIRVWDWDVRQGSGVRAAGFCRSHLHDPAHVSHLPLLLAAKETAAVRISAPARKRNSCRRVHLSKHGSFSNRVEPAGLCRPQPAGRSAGVCRTAVHPELHRFACLLPAANVLSRRGHSSSTHLVDDAGGEFARDREGSDRHETVAVNAGCCRKMSRMKIFYLVFLIVVFVSSVLAQQDSPPITVALPDYPLAFGGFLMRFDPAGTFTLEGSGWPRLNGNWKTQGSEIELLMTGAPAG